MAYLLEPVGLSESDNAVYLALVGAPKASLAELADRVHLPVGSVRRAMTRLVGAGLVTKMLTRPTRYLPAPPDTAVEALVARRRRELQDLRIAAGELALRLERPASSGPAGLVELLEGDEVIQHHLEQTQAQARAEVLIIDTPPYLQGAPVRNEGELANLARGVAYRCIYDRPALEEPGHFDDLVECVRAGEQARTLISVSMKMQIVDREIAIIPVSFTQTETRTRLLVRASPMLDALVQCFESLWHQAVPVAMPAGSGNQGAPDAPDGERDLALLTLLGAGMKDRAIARTLGVTERTLSRYIRELMDSLEADTRFQAGIQAARLGLLRAHPEAD
ncbi:helix-turn-helix domain-containing protein [Actinokineospora sp.]|uniref:helix-turn-helix domain-containing protein n=1 Tax=Actinokineospora sp. TaxID=1872133 RepID=UPI003D6B5469